MIGPPRVETRGRAPAGFLGMLALVVAVEAIVAGHDLDLTTVWVAAWADSGAHARGDAARSEVVCLGDSLIKYGVAPAVLEGRLGRSAYNLAVFNGQAPTSYFLLRRVLETGARPSAVVIDGETLEEDPRTHERRWSELLDAREIYEFARDSRDPRLFGSLMLGHFVPTVRARHELRAAVVAALGGLDVSGRSVVLSRRRNWDANRGAHVEPTEPSAAGRREEIARSGYLPAEWACDRLNALYVRKLMKLADAHDLPVFWLLPPLHPDVHERRTRGGMHGRFLRFVRAVQARHPNLTVIDGRDADYDPSAFVDLTHLNALGATAFTSDVADVLRGRLAPGGSPSNGPRWVTLPHYRAKAPDAVLEDVRQSAALLKASDDARARR